jgi:hypothetical protein
VTVRKNYAVVLEELERGEEAARLRAQAEVAGAGRP